MNQTEFADYVGVNQKTLSAYERGQVIPRLDIIVTICKTCGISVDYLLGLEPAKNVGRAVIWKD